MSDTDFFSVMPQKNTAVVDAELIFKVFTSNKNCGGNQSLSSNFHQTRNNSVCDF